MADNVTTQSTTLATIPASTKIATDEDATNGHVQIVKLAISTDGSATPLTADNTDGLLVNLGSNNDVTLATLPDTAAGDLAAINAALGGTLTVGSHAVTNAGTFAVQEDGAALTALQLIDDVIYIDDADWTDGVSKHALVGGLYQSVPQTITDGDVGPIQVDSNGNIIESNSAAILADTASMDTNLTTLAGAVAGSQMQVDIVADGADLLTNTTHNAAFGTAGSADTQVRTVQGIAAMTPLLVDATGQGDVPVTLAGEAVTISGTVTVDLGANNDVTIDNSSIVLAEDAIHNTGDTGVMALSVRNDTLAALAGTDGDYAPLQVNASGALYVQEGSALDVSAATVTVTDNGSFTLAANSGVDIGDVDVTSIIPGTGATNLGKAEDAAHTTGDTGVMALAVQQTADAALAGTTGDYAPLQVDETGYLKVNIKAGSGSGTEYTEDAAAPANPAGGAVALVRQDTPAALTSLDGDIVAQRATNYGAAFVQVLDSSGNFVDSFSGSGGTSATDDAAFTAGSGSGTPMMGFATSDVVDSGDVGVLAMDTSRNLKVSIEVDNAGIGGGTQYAVDDALGATPTGTLALAIRDNALSALTPVEGDAIGLRVDGTGALWVATDDTITVTDDGSFTLAANDGVDIGDVTINNASIAVTNGGTFAVQEDGAALTALQLIDDAIVADDAAFTPATTKVMMAGFEFDDVTPDPVDEGDAGAARMSANRNIYTTIRDAAGNERGVNVSASNELSVVESNSAAILADTANMDTNLGTIAGAVAGSEMQVDIVAVTPDLMLGTDFSDVMGTASLITATQVDNLVNTTDTLNTSALLYGFDGTTWDRLRGDATDGLLVNLGTNNDITVTGTATVDNAGTFAVQEDGAALTALQLIDDGVYTDDTSTHTTAVSKGYGIMGVATPTDTAVDANDFGHLAMSTDRRLLVDSQIVGQDADITIADGGNAITVDWNGTAPPIGAGTEAAALRVTVATDSTGVLSVDDNGGALTVDAANDGSLNVTIGDGSNTATIRNLAANDALNVAIVDGSGGQITSFGGGTEYTEDDAGAANPVGATLTFIRADTPATLTSLDGDVVGLRGSDYGAGYVTILDGSGNVINSFSGSGGTSHTDDAAFSIGSASSITPVGYLADDTTPDSVDEGDVGVARMTLTRKPYAVITDATSENNAAVDGSGHLQVDIAADSASLATSANQSTMITALQIMDDWDNAASDGASVSGDVAHDTADAGEPVKVGHKAIAHGTNPTAVAAADRTDWYSNRAGIPWVIGGHPNVISFEYNTTGAQTDDNILAAIATGTKYILTSIETTLDSATDVGYRIGFGSTTLTSEGASGADAVSKIVLSHPGLKDGSGQHKGDGSGIVGIGGDGEELRITCDAPDTKLRVTGTYYTVPS